MQNVKVVDNKNFTKLKKRPSFSYRRIASVEIPIRSATSRMVYFFAIKVFSYFIVNQLYTLYHICSNNEKSNIVEEMYAEKDEVARNAQFMSKILVK